LNSRSSLAAALLFAALLPPFANAFPLEPPKRTVSTSRQFVIYSDNPSVRAETSMRAEDDKREFLEALGAKDDWKLPIILNIGAPPPVTRRPPQTLLGIYEGDNGLNKVQLDVFDTEVLKDPVFDSLLIGTLALESAYRNTPVKAGRRFEQPPAWFVEGLAERIRTRESGLPASLYAGLLSTGEAPSLREFLGTQPARLDATSLAIYRAQAAALLDAVLELPDGHSGLRAWLSQPRRATENPDELAAMFPSLARSREALARKWVLAMARASAANRVDALTMRETASELDDVLAVKALPDPKRPEVASMSGPYALPTIARSQSGKFILSQTEASLLRLSLRAHPLYKSLVEEYLAIVRELLRKPKKREDKRIATAEQVRAALNRESSETRDYLDWVEATKIKTENPELTKAVEETETIEQAPPRTDAISRYLDAVSERGQ
jgi:hypothetical protein